MNQTFPSKFSVPPKCSISLVYDVSSALNLFTPFVPQWSLEYSGLIVMTVTYLINNSYKPDYFPQPKSLECSMIFINTRNFTAAFSYAEILNRYYTRDSIYFIWSLDSERKLRLPQKAHPYVVVITEGKNGAGASWSPLCYLCPKYLEAGKDFGLLPSFSTLQGLLKDINSVGFGKPAYVTDLEEFDTQKLRNVQTSMRLNWRDGYTVKVIVGILSQKFNFTVSKEDVVSGPRLFVCNHCDVFPNPDTSGRRPGYTNMHVNDESLFYCLASVQYKSESSYAFLLTPFDRWIWIGVLATFASFLIIYRSFWFSLNILWGLLGIPYERQWSKMKLLTIVSIPMLVLQYYYIGFFTSDVVLPFPPSQIESSRDLFVTHGYRWLRTSCDSKESWQDYANRKRQSFTRSGLDPNSTNFHILSENCTLDLELQLGTFVGKAALIVQTKFVKQKAAKIAKAFPKYYCTGVKEVWTRQMVTTNYDSHMSEAYGKALGFLKEYGIDDCFEKIYLAGSDKEAMSRSSNTNAENSTSGHLYNLFELCLYLLLGCFSVLILEVAYSRRKIVCQFLKNPELMEMKLQQFFSNLKSKERMKNDFITPSPGLFVVRNDRRINR